MLYCADVFFINIISLPLVLYLLLLLLWLYTSLLYVYDNIHTLFDLWFIKAHHFAAIVFVAVN